MEDPTKRSRYPSSELANDRLTMVAFKGMTFPDGTFGTTGPQVWIPGSAVESELCVQAPARFWDPVGFREDGDVDDSKRRRETELKHGSVAMCAAMSFIRLRCCHGGDGRRRRNRGEAGRHEVLLDEPGRAKGLRGALLPRRVEVLLHREVSAWQGDRNALSTLPGRLGSLRHQGLLYVHDVVHRRAVPSLRQEPLHEVRCQHDGGRRGGSTGPAHRRRRRRRGLRCCHGGNGRRRRNRGEAGRHEGLLGGPGLAEEWRSALLRSPVEVLLYREVPAQQGARDAMRILRGQEGRLQHQELHKLVCGLGRRLAVPALREEPLQQLRRWEAPGAQRDSASR
jgi:hypothetical protein